jgi:hypothetical protein
MRRAPLQLGMAVVMLVPISLRLSGAELKRETVDAFDQYVAALESHLETRWRGQGFLWSDGLARREELHQGAVLTAPASGNGNIEIKGGMIQDWAGAVFIPSANIASVLAVAQDYAHHDEIYKPEVAKASVRSRSGNDFAVYMQLLKSKLFLSVVLDSEHEIHFVAVDSKRVYSRAYSTRIAEVSNAGKPTEHELPVGRDRGLLWRMNGYWFFEERAGGVIVECESVTLTRDIPFGMRTLLSPIIRELPAEALRKSLDSTRKAVSERR